MKEEDERRKKVVKVFFNNNNESLPWVIKKTINSHRTLITKCYCNQCGIVFDIGLSAIKRLEKNTLPGLTSSPLSLVELSKDENILRQTFVVIEPCFICRKEAKEKIKVLVKYIPKNLKDLNLDVPLEHKRKVNNHACP